MDDTCLCIADAGPTLRPVAMRRDPTWCVLAAWPDGEKRCITGFLTETEAQDWIDHAPKDWALRRDQRR